MAAGSIAKTLPYATLSRTHRAARARNSLPCATSRHDPSKPLMSASSRTDARSDLIGALPARAPVAKQVPPWVALLGLLVGQPFVHTVISLHQLLPGP